MHDLIWKHSWTAEETLCPVQEKGWYRESQGLSWPQVTHHASGVVFLRGKPLFRRIWSLLKDKLGGLTGKAAFPCLFLFHLSDNSCMVHYTKGRIYINTVSFSFPHWPSVLLWKRLWIHHSVLIKVWSPPSFSPPCSDFCLSTWELQLEAGWGQTRQCWVTYVISMSESRGEKEGSRGRMRNKFPLALGLRLTWTEDHRDIPSQLLIPWKLFFCAIGKEAEKKLVQEEGKLRPSWSYVERACAEEERCFGVSATQEPRGHWQY